MNEPSPESGDRREAWIAALLQTALNPPAANDDPRLESVLQRIAAEATAARPASTAPSSPAPRRWNRWLSWSLAAGLLLALFIGWQTFGSNAQAWAALQQSLAAAAESVARHYTVTVTLQSSDGSSQIRNDLYVQGNQRFALRHPALLPGADLWLGQTGDETWIVPALGPVRTGNDLALSRWLSAQEPLSTPYLHVSTVLSRMSRGYRLRELGEATVQLADGRRFECRHVLGQRRWGVNGKLPATLELWSDLETGVAVRLEARWNLAAGEAGRLTVAIEFVGEPQLPENWFTAAGHYSGVRRVIRIDENEGLDESPAPSGK